LRFRKKGEYKTKHRDMITLAATTPNMSAVFDQEEDRKIHKKIVKILLGENTKRYIQTD
jgi:hypothetical protein